MARIPGTFGKSKGPKCPGCRRRGVRLVGVVFGKRVCALCAEYGAGRLKP